MENLNTAEYCGLITRDRSSPFSSCLAQYPGLLTHADDCAFDVCANKNNTDDAKEAACGSLKALADACAHKGFEVNWRSKAKCRKIAKFSSESGHKHAFDYINN